MKKKVILTTIWITGLFLSSFFYLPQLPKVQAFPLDYEIKAEVNPSIETLQIFYLLKSESNYSQCEFENTIFKKLSLEWFSPFADHKAVKDFNAVISEEYSQEQLMTLFSKFTFNNAGTFDLSSTELKSNQQLASWMVDVNDFLVQSQSETFSSRMNDYYSLLLDSLSPRSPFMKTLNKIASFFAFNQCKVYVTPTLMHQFYLIPDQNNDHLSFTIILGLQSIQNGYISFTSSKIQQDLLYTALLNQCLEFSLTDYQSNIDQLSVLWPSIQESMIKDQIETWNKAFQEHLRISLLVRLFPEPNTLELYQNKVNSGYSYLPATSGIVEEYLRQRPFYQNFSSLMRLVLIRFSSISS